MKQLSRYHYRYGSAAYTEDRTYFIPNVYPPVHIFEPNNFVSSMTYRFRDGGVSPLVNRKRIYRSNWFANHTFVGVFNPGVSKIEQWEYGWHIYKSIPFYIPHDPRSYVYGLNTPYDVNGALIRLFDKLDEYKVNMAVFFAERQKTLDMVANKLEKVFRAYRDVKRGNPRRAARRLGIKSHNPRSKQAAGQWLELQYGWRPLIGDVHSMLNLQGAGIPTGVFGVAVEQFELDVNRQDLYWFTGKYTGHTVAKVGCDVAVSDPASAFANRIGLINPATVVWELVPFSFVIDWALPIGDHLDRLTTMAGLSFSNEYLSRVLNGEVKGQTDYLSKFRNLAGSREATFYGTFTETSRDAPYRITIPSLEITNPISPLHLANAIALGRQFR